MVNDINVRREEQAHVLAKALGNAMELWGIKQTRMAKILGVSQPVISDFISGRRLIQPHEKRGELALLFLRCFRSLDALMGGGMRNQHEWLNAHNNALGGVPVELMERCVGLVSVAEYLDDMRGHG